MNGGSSQNLLGVVDLKTIQDIKIVQEVIETNPSLKQAKFRELAKHRSSTLDNSPHIGSSNLNSPTKQLNR